MKTVVSKGEFAARMQRSPACVTKWIRLGRISQDALIGEGNSAKIWLERARNDLASSLDPSQQAIQIAPIEARERPCQITESAPPAAQDRAPIALPVSERERDLARRAKADADKAEHDAEAARRKLALDEGRYVVAEEAAATWGREMSKLAGEVDVFISTALPREIAEHYNLDWKSVAALMRASYRRFRAGASEAARERRGAIEDDSTAES